MSNGGGDDKRVGEILAVKNNSSTCPATDEIAWRGVFHHILKFTEIPERERPMIPTIKTDRWARGRFEQSLVYRHI